MSLANLKKSFLDLLSFNGPKAIVVVLSIVLFFLFFLPTENLADLPVKSLYSSVVIPIFFNGSCPSEGILKNCGFYSIGETRGVSSILHGKFKEAYEYNPLSFVLLFVIVVILAINIMKLTKFKPQSRFFRYLFR